LSQNILITGCSGFLATHLLDRLEKDQDVDIFGLTEIADFQSSRMTVYNIDITNRDKVFDVIEEVKPDLVFHFAAIANVGFSWKHQKLTYEINFIGSSNLLEALSLHAPNCRVMMMSTAELYGNTKTTPYKESDRLCSPRNPYALSKMAMEMAGELYINSRGMNIIRLRSFNFTGPAQDRKFVASDFSCQIAEIEKGLRKPVIRVGNLSAVRDLSDVRDISRYLHVIAKEGDSGAVYNLCAGKTYSIQEILDLLMGMTDQEIKVFVDENKLRPVDVPVLMGDNSLIKKKFNLKPEYEIDWTLRDLLNYWRAQVRGV